MAPVTAHTTWLERDGAPTDIAAIAQTTDGFLWLGTPFGLYRFDGTQFASYPVTTLSTPLPSNDVTALLSDREGGLWIGYHAGGISHLRVNGAVESYSLASRLGPNSAQKFVYAADGTLWAIGDNHLYRFEANHWENFGNRSGLPDDPLLTLFIDRSGTMWTSTRGRLFSMKEGGGHFTPYPTQTFMVVDMAQMPDGEIWICDAWKTIRPLHPREGHRGWEINGYVRMAMENSGDLWLAQDYRGVTHLNWPHSSIALTKEEGLTSEQTNAIFADRDNNVWVGTSRGLDRFHSTQVKHLIHTRVEYYPEICAAPEGGAWIGILSEPIIFASHDVVRAVGTEVGSAPILCRDDGSVWMVDPLANKLTSWTHGRMARIALPPDVHLASAHAIGLDRDGALLMAFRPYGLWRFDGSWTRVVDAGLPQDEPLSIFRDSQRRVWLGYENGIIGLRDDSGSRTFVPTADSSLGNVLAFTVADGRVWAAGTNGASYFELGAFHRISLARSGVLRGVSGMVQDYAGNLWFNTGGGLYRILHAQLTSSLEQGLEYDRFDDRQGVEGTATQGDPTPSLVLDKAGPLWASTTGALLEIDPTQIMQTVTKPLLVMERLLLNGSVVGDREHPVSHIAFKGTSLKELEIDYSGVDLSAPEKIRYRYMLEGKDPSWQEVGDRRQAFYDHLSPGHYTFRVSESDDLGQWTDLTLPLSVVVQPAFYETYWFMLLMALAVIGILYLAYSLRVRIVTNALRLKMQERANERLRISRELHDTLLQSIHGLMLRFHFATNELPPDEPAREPLQLALQRADDAFLEARQRIELLRDEVPDEPHFNQQLFQMAQGLDIQSCLDFAVNEEGEPRVIVGKVQAELCRIAREALINTMNHAKATNARVSLIYSSSDLRMRCGDNGVGIPEEILKRRQRPGHWGLVGIAERVATIDGKLTIRSTGGAGTTLEIKIPARRAYRNDSTWCRILRYLNRRRDSVRSLDK
ncbi:sensor histidine kinase [Bryocella elongata]|nr:sensor histidine kinase [Bryocella elongata]